MKQIVFFSQRYLHNGEHDQLHSNFAAEIETQTAQKLGIVAETTAYNAARANEKLALQQEQGSVHTETISTTDGFRDETDKGFCMFVESNLYHPQPEIREKARRIMRIIDQYGNLRKLNYNEESSQLVNRNAEIVNNYASDLAALGNGWGTAWLNSLNEVNTQFVEHFGTRTSEQTSKVTINTLEARAATDAAWEAIVTRINALVVVNGDTNYATFIDKANYYIEYNKTLLNVRKGKKVSATEESK